MDDTPRGNPLDKARSFLEHHENAVWIGNSALLLRAFYLGVYSQTTDDGDRERVLLEMVHKTMLAKASDDLFQSTSLGVAVRAIRELLIHSLGRPEDHARAVDDSERARLADVVRCIDSLDETRRLHCETAKRELATINPGTTSREEAIRVLDMLERVFKILALGDAPRYAGRYPDAQ